MLNDACSHIRTQFCVFFIASAHAHTHPSNAGCSFELEIKVCVSAFVYFVDLDESTSGRDDNKSIQAHYWLPLE